MIQKSNLSFSPDQIKALEEEIQLRELQLRMRECLPHLYGHKMYRWQRQFFDATNKYCTLVASNQSGKSTIQIRKCIRWATDKDLWPKLWKTAPIQFWYLYPDYQTSNSEVLNKWVREFLPREEFKDHPVYGWKIHKRGQDIEYIRFNSGVSVYFKAYSQDVMNLQGGSVHAVWGDEEVPWDLISELQMRIAATNGYMSFAFTATRGQEEWRKVVEERGPHEMWKEGEVDILKIQVSAYDCLTYEDGTPSSVWSIEKIEETKKFLHTEAQIERRIMGRFIKDSDLAYEQFNRKRHLIDIVNVDLSKGSIYAGMDYGSGTNHQSSICLVWVNDEHTYGVAFALWLGEKGIPTTCGDVIAQYQKMTKGLKVTRTFYDWSARDLKTIAESLGLFVESADKNHSTGQRILNTLFQNDQLKLMKVGSYEELSSQLETLSTEDCTPAKKKYANDDICDALRYTVTRIPWVHVNLREKPVNVPISYNNKIRFEQEPPKPQDTFEDELMEWMNDFDY